jgi:hypothetical protein
MVTTPTSFARSRVASCLGWWARIPTVSGPIGSFPSLSDPRFELSELLADDANHQLWVVEVDVVPGMTGHHVGAQGREPADELFLHGYPGRIPMLASAAVSK